MPREPIDLRVVQAARQRLDALAQAHPELMINKGAPSASVGAWERELEESMAKSLTVRQRAFRDSQAKKGNVQVALWLPADTVKALDALKAKHGGSRSAVVTVAVEALRKQGV